MNQKSKPSAATRPSSDHMLADYYFQMGESLRRGNNLDEARKAFMEVARLLPDHSMAQNEVGVRLMDMGYADLAASCLMQAVKADAGNALAMSNLGQILGRLGRVDEALAWQKKASQFAPEHPGVLTNLCAALNAVNQFGEAESVARKALEAQPDLVSGHINLADALAGRGDFPAAIASLRRALEYSPGHNDALTNLGNALEAVGEYEQAEDAFRAVSDDQGYALSKAMQCAAQVCNWDRLEADRQSLLKGAHSNRFDFTPFGALSLDLPDASSLLRTLAQRHGAQYILSGSRGLVAPMSSIPQQAGKLTIGYLSADIHDHATMHLLAGVLRSHDKAQFSVNIYSYGVIRHGEYRQLAMRHADVFRDLSEVGDDEAAQVIAQDGVDILVDLKGYTRQARPGIQARRPASVMVSWLGYPGTLGSTQLADYIIGDPVVTPEGVEPHYAERIVRMPNCYQPNDDQREIGAKPTRESVGLPDAEVVFCSFNQAYKITPDTLQAWGRILLGVKASVLWLLEAGEAADARLVDRLGEMGVARDRIIFAQRLPATEHLGRLQLADLALDTYPYGSHTTGSDALWAGVPLMARTGDTFASRVSTSLVQAVGLPGLAAADWDSYVGKVIDIANDPAQLAWYQQQVRSARRGSPLFDTRQFTQDLESLYQQIKTATGPVSPRP